MQKLSFKHLEAIFLMAFFSIIGALFISTGDFLLILGGILCIITLVSIETYYLQKIAFQVKKINKKLQKSIEQARMTMKSMQIMLEQMERLMPKAQMPDVLSNIYSTMEDQRSLIHSDIERYCQQRLNRLVKKFEDLESRIGKLEKS